MWNKLWDRLKSVSPHTWARTACFFLALINQILATFGRERLPFLEDDIYQTVSLLATVVTGIIAWWKDNPITPEAQKSNAYMKTLKAKATIASLQDEIDAQAEEIETFEASYSEESSDASDVPDPDELAAADTENPEDNNK